MKSQTPSSQLPTSEQPTPQLPAPALSNLNIVALAGGVGGAKLATGLQAIAGPGRLTVVVNTGDDFEHWGLNICPDLDTILYNLADIHNPETGWGRVEETFATLESVSQLGGEDWFRLGDRDLALHLRRTEWLRQGVSLTEITDRLRRSLGIVTEILPMSDDPVRTLVHTDEGDLPFQHYFVRRKCEPTVIDISFVGASQARINPAVISAVEQADLIVLCPSNPYLSIDPILAVNGMARLIRHAAAPKVAVSPIIGGAAVKGPAAKLMREMGQMVSPITVVDHFDGLLDGFVLDRADESFRRAVDLPVLVTDTLMTDAATRKRLAQETVYFGATIQVNGSTSASGTSTGSTSTDGTSADGRLADDA